MAGGRAGRSHGGRTDGRAAGHRSRPSAPPSHRRLVVVMAGRAMYSTGARSLHLDRADRTVLLPAVPCSFRRRHTVHRSTYRPTFTKDPPPKVSVHRVSDIIPPKMSYCRPCKFGRRGGHAVHRSSSSSLRRRPQSAVRGFYVTATATATFSVVAELWATFPPVLASERAAAQSAEVGDCPSLNSSKCITDVGSPQLQTPSLLADHWRSVDYTRWAEKVTPFRYLSFLSS